jgi:hypothetical protein
MRVKGWINATFKEHRATIASEGNLERQAFYEFCWHLGVAESDVASLTAREKYK